MRQRERERQREGDTQGGRDSRWQHEGEKAEITVLRFIYK